MVVLLCKVVTLALVPAVTGLLVTVLGIDTTTNKLFSNIANGSTAIGFSISRTAVGKYTITFSPAFSALPSVTLTALSDGTNATYPISTDGTLTTSGSNWSVNITNPPVSAFNDRPWTFIAIGPR